MNVTRDPSDTSGPAEILIAEDSRTQAELLRYLLEGAGYHVTAGVNGAEALAAARRQKPVLVISDVEMPVMSGYEMCREIKGDPGLRGVPVILLTSLSDPADVLRGLEAKADYYLTKPYDSEYLLARVRSILATPAPAADEPPAPPLEVSIDGNGHVVTAGRRQILNLLLSTYGNAVQRNQELIRTERRLQEQNGLLEATARAEREAHEALKRAQAHLVQTEKLAGLGQMVAGVAHEINNPLAFVSNNAAVLQRDIAALGKLLALYQQSEGALIAARQPSEVRELLGPIQEIAEQLDVPYTLSNLKDILTRTREGLRRIEQIVKDLREFARLDESDLSEVDVNAGVESTIHIIRIKAVEKGVRIETEPGAVPLLTCFPAKINQVVMNLVTNAIDASEAGGSVTVRTGSVDGEVRIDVTDTGRGIDPTIRDRIFDPFFTTKPLGQGTGLGLSISYGIVQDHGGTIEVDSTVGKGSRFTVRLPRRDRST